MHAFQMATPHRRPPLMCRPLLNFIGPPWAATNTSAGMPAQNTPGSGSDSAGQTLPAGGSPVSPVGYCSTWLVDPAGGATVLQPPDLHLAMRSRRLRRKSRL